MTKRQKNLRRLLYPKSIVVVGGRSAETVIEQCQKIGFPGQIYAVNPSRKRLAGIACYASVDLLPVIPDACFLAVSATLTVSLVEQLAQFGVGGAICFAAGFAEITEQGRDLQDQLVESAGDMAVIGPNCHGVVNYLENIALWPDHHGGQSVAQGVALIVQSGNIGISLTFQQRSLDISHVIAVGNNAQLKLHEYIDVLLKDDRVTAIGLHLEELVEVQQLSLSLLKALNKNVPVVAIKTGRSELGAKMTLSHTNSIAPASDLISLFFARFGVAECTDLDEFIETLKLVSMVGSLHEASIGSLSCSGGEASLIADLAETHHVTLPALSVVSKAQLFKVLGDHVHIVNPLDYHMYIWADLEKLTECFVAMMASNTFGCFVLILDYPTINGVDDSAWLIAEQALISAAGQTGKKAFIVSTLADNFPDSARRRLLEAKIVPMQGLGQTLKAVRNAARIGSAKAKLDNIKVVRTSNYQSAPPQTIMEHVAKQELRRVGVKTPMGFLCKYQDVLIKAEELRFPLVLKAANADLVHKSEVNGVRLNLDSMSQVEQALSDMANLSEQFIVEEMVEGALIELLIGIKHDVYFGLVLVLGAGGTEVELHKDTMQLLLPTDSWQIREALYALRLAPKLQGFRGSPRVDVDSIVDIIEKILDYAYAHKERLCELEINPLMVTPSEVVAADAFLSVWPR